MVPADIVLILNIKPHPRYGSTSTTTRASYSCRRVFATVNLFNHPTPTNPPPHTHRFEREGDDLVHTVNVTLEQALTGVDVSVETLDGRTLRYVCVCLVVVV